MKKYLDFTSFRGNVLYDMLHSICRRYRRSRHILSGVGCSRRTVIRGDFHCDKQPISRIYDC